MGVTRRLQMRELVVERPRAEMVCAERTTLICGLRGLKLVWSNKVYDSENACMQLSNFQLALTFYNISLLNYLSEA